MRKSGGLLISEMSEAAAEQRQGRQMRSICVIPSASSIKENKNSRKKSKKYWTNAKKCDILIIASIIIEGFPSGQRGRTVNPLAELSMVRIHLPRPIFMRKWLRGRASPCQGEGREFESRLPLQFFCGCSSMVEPQPSKLMA